MNEDKFNNHFLSVAESLADEISMALNAQIFYMIFERKTREDGAISHPTDFHSRSW